MNCYGTEKRGRGAGGEGQGEKPAAPLSLSPHLLSLTPHASRPAPHAPLLLIIAYGNSLRRDDGAGIALAEKITEIWQQQGMTAHLITVAQLTPELAAAVAVDGLAAVFFVDAAIATGQDAIQVQPVHVEPATPALGHHCSPATLLLYAALLYQHTPSAWLVTLPGNDFGHGEGFSPAVEQLLTTAPLVAKQLAERVFNLW